MMNFDIAIEGLENIAEKLENLSSGGVMKAASKGLEKGLLRIQSDAKANAPVDSGDLRQRIVTRVQGDADGITGEVAATAEHSVFVEMGTGPKGQANHAGISPEAASKVTYSPKGWVAPIKGTFRYTEGMPARPFLYPAYKANQKKLKQDIADAIIKEAGE